MEKKRINVQAAALKMMYEAGEVECRTAKFYDETRKRTYTRIIYHSK